MSGLELRLACNGERGFSLELDSELPAQGVTAIYGPSGSGKSTLLDCIAGLRQANAGSVIRFAGETWQQGSQQVPSWERRIGYVFQDARLFPHLDVRQNLQYALHRCRSISAIDLEQVAQMLEITELLEQSTETLSAGQRQRVAIARALLSAPRLMLLDEPLANLDQPARQQCLRCLRRLAGELALPMLYVSHDIEEVSQLADHLVLLESGKVVEQDSLLTLCSRLDTRLSREEQAAAIIAARVAAHDSDFGLTELVTEGQALFVNHIAQATGSSCRVRIPARDISLCRQRPLETSILNILAVTVSEIEQTDAPRLIVRLSLGAQYLLARITRKSAVELQLAVGDTVYAQIKSAALLMEAADPA